MGIVLEEGQIETILQSAEVALAGGPRRDATTSTAEDPRVDSLPMTTNSSLRPGDASLRLPPATPAHDVMTVLLFDGETPRRVERATLLRSASSRSYGVVMELADREARALYSEPSVRGYRPERVRVELLDTGEAVEVDCYNLPGELGRAGANPAYANELSRLVEALQFDPSYVDEIAAFGEVS